MSKKNVTTVNSRYISANATLSNISVTDQTNVNSGNLSTQSKTILSNSSPNDNQIQPQQVKSDMKENNKQTITTEKNNEENKNKQKTEQPKNSVPISKLSIIAIGLTICLGGFLYFHSHQQAALQQATIAELKNEISTLKETLQNNIRNEIKSEVQDSLDAQNIKLTSLEQKITQQLNNQTQTQQQFINRVDDTIKVSEQNLSNLNERLAAMSTTDNKVWLISQANYLINLAGRKIWNEQDYTTARLLLKNADSSLAQANDPSLLPARQAINKDISALASISFTDFDGIVMSLMELTDSVTELPLVDHYKNIDLGMTQHDDSIADASGNSDNTDTPADGTDASQTNEISHSIADWYDNLAKSTASFFEKFIQIEKYDSFGECIASAGDNAQLLEKCQAHIAVIMPEQALYLRENIKLRLLIAAQAVPRHQEFIYQQALNDVSVWVNAYFDSNSSSVKVFLNDLADLQQQSISNHNIPEQLTSQDELSKLMQTRVRAMLAE